MRTTHADALAQAGRLARAEALFREAEALQKEMQPGLPRLYSLQGYHILRSAARPRPRRRSRRSRMLTDRSGAAEMTAICSTSRLEHADASPRGAGRSAACRARARQDCAERSSASARRPAPRQHRRLYLPRRPAGPCRSALALWRRQGRRRTAPRGRNHRRARPHAAVHGACASAARPHRTIASTTSPPRTAKRDAALELIQKHGYGRAAPEAAVLNAEIACAENAASRDAKIAAAVTAIRGEPYL